MLRYLIRLIARRLRRQPQPFLRSVAIVVGLVYAGAFGFLAFEQQVGPDGAVNYSLEDALWWAIVTMTTVGYGDISPVTSGGRWLVAVPLMIVGVAILGYALSAVAAVMVEARSRAARGLRRIHMEDHVIVVNYPGPDKMDRILTELRHDESTEHCGVVLVDSRLEECPPKLVKQDVRFVKGDTTAEETFDRAGLAKAKWLAVLARDPGDGTSDDTSLATTLLAKHLNPKIHIVAEAVDESAVGLMQRAGADSVVCVAYYASHLLVQELQDPGVKDVVADLTSNRVGQQIYVIDIESLADNSFGTLRRWAHDQGAMCLGYRQADETIFNPADDSQVPRGAQAVLVAERRVGPVRA